MELIDRFDASEFPTKFAAQIKNFSSDGCAPDQSCIFREFTLTACPTVCWDESQHVQDWHPKNVHQVYRCTGAVRRPVDKRSSIGWALSFCSLVNEHSETCAG